MGSVTLTGNNNYMWLVADSVSSGSISAPGGADLLLQYSPFTNSNTIGVEEFAPEAAVAQKLSSPISASPISASMAQQTNYNNVDHFAGIPATTLAIGGSQQTGSITIGAGGLIDIGSKNMLFISSQTIASPANIVTTGIVAASGIVGTLQPVATLQPTAFVNPRLETIRVNDRGQVIDDEDRDDSLVDDLSEDSGMCIAI